MPKKKPLTIPELLWNSLALVQAKIDDVVQMWFQWASKLWKTKVRQGDHIAKKIVFRTFSFIWDVWNNFYKEYKNLKKGKN